MKLNFTNDAKLGLKLKLLALISFRRERLSYEYLSPITASKDINDEKTFNDFHKLAIVITSVQ